ncbi:protein lifeguard 1-like isoform X2 [Diorhabda sublineata]|uniref:protein lifeguard 1-like isoform X2 n=1 Tax=Diorhabda sublineata TaxID=1163346 RepID=UPI0024E16F62|nr:protein lifeguard 1-like isoform X2 [Diorhabda sublineata]
MSQYPPNPNQGYYGGQQPGYPPQGSYPPPGGYNPQGGYPAAPPPGSYPPPNQGYQPAPPPYIANDPYSTGEHVPFSSNTTGYGEDPEVKGFDFSDASIRRGFIRKVYAILSVQLGITLSFICWFLYHRPTREYVYSHIGLFYASLVIVFVAMIALACCGDLRRKAPANYIFLFIFTLAESFCLACSASTFKADAVAMAVGITAAVCLGLTLFAFQTKWDFTMMGGILFVAVIILLVFGIVAIFVRSKVFQLLYASFGALLFSIYLIYDTQLMMGGKHKYSISPEEYIFAAMNLYVDIINIFMYILAIIGQARD